MSFSIADSNVTASSAVGTVMAPLPTASEVIQLVQVMGRSDAMKYVTKQQELFGRCLTGYYRTSSSSSGSSNGCGSSVHSGVRSGGRSSSPRQRLAQLRALPSWRSNRRTTDGLCYSNLMVDGAVESEVMRLGEWPTLGRLLASDWRSFSSVQELEQHATVDFDSDTGMAHVRRDGSGVHGFVDLAAGVAWQHPQRKGSFGALLKASVGNRFPPLPVGFSSGVRFGGDTSAGRKFVYTVGDELPNVSFVFLAGTNEKNVGPGWREELVSGRGLRQATVVTPRSTDLSHLSHTLSARAAWERNAMHEAGAIVFNFCSGASSSVSLMELGLFIGTGKVHVSCSPGFERRDSVIDLCNAYSVPVYGTVSAAYLAAVRQAVPTGRLGEAVGDAEDRIVNAAGWNGLSTLTELQGMAILGSYLGVRGMRDPTSKWTFVEALAEEPEYYPVEFVVSTGQKVSYSVVMEGDSFVGFLGYSGRVMYPLFSGSISPARFMAVAAGAADSGFSIGRVGDRHEGAARAVVV